MYFHMDLDNKANIQKLDKSDISSSLSHFADQCVQGWEEIINLDIPDDYEDIDNVVCLAMGGSVLGAQVCHHIFKTELEIPFHYYSDYKIPNYINENTLAIVVSNSGSTEETIASYNEVRLKTKKIIGITKGSKLGELLENDNHPIYLIDDKQFNPSSVPRVAVGFQLGAYFAILSRLGLIDLSEEKFQETITQIKNEEITLNVDTPEVENKAKKMARELQGKISMIISSEHLNGSAKATNNQMNESGKVISANFELPDVNHHQLEGMQFPTYNPDNIVYYLIESNLYHDRNQKRYGILKMLLDDLGIQHVSYKATLSDKIGQALEVFQFGAYMTYYMGLLNNVDPAPNPFVDKFKELLNN